MAGCWPWGGGRGSAAPPVAASREGLPGSRDWQSEELELGASSPPLVSVLAGIDRVLRSPLSSLSAGDVSELRRAAVTLLASNNLHVSDAPTGVGSRSSAGAGGEGVSGGALALDDATRSWLASEATASRAPAHREEPMASSVANVASFVVRDGRVVTRSRSNSLEDGEGEDGEGLPLPLVPVAQQGAVQKAQLMRRLSSRAQMHLVAHPQRLGDTAPGTPTSGGGAEEADAASGGAGELSAALGAAAAAAAKGAADADALPVSLLPPTAFVAAPPPLRSGTETTARSTSSGSGGGPSVTRASFLLAKAGSGGGSDGAKAKSFMAKASNALASRFPTSSRQVSSTAPMHTASGSGTLPSVPSEDSFFVNQFSLAGAMEHSTVDGEVWMQDRRTILSRLRASMLQGSSRELSRGTKSEGSIRPFGSVRMEGDVVVSDMSEEERAVLDRLRIVTSWNFDVFDFSKNTGGRPLAFVSYELFLRFGLFDPEGPVRVPEETFTNFINKIERDYCFEPSKPNPYHMHVHAADVVQAVGCFLIVPRLAQMLDQKDAFAMLTASIIHDYRHPGVNNGFLMKTSHAIALRYNDDSVLENFHVAEGFAVMALSKYDIMKGLAPAARASARYIIIKCVLATDIAQGAKYTNAFKSKTALATMGESDEDRLLTMQMLIKCADVSHPARALHVHEDWSARITEEFYLQGDIEVSLGLPISPLCDRKAHNLAKSQIGFIEFVVKPCFSVLTDFLQLSTWMDILLSNLAHWKALAALPAAPAPAALTIAAPPAPAAAGAAVPAAEASTSTAVVTASPAAEGTALDTVVAAPPSPPPAAAAPTTGAGATAAAPETAPPALPGQVIAADDASPVLSVVTSAAAEAGVVDSGTPPTP